MPNLEKPRKQFSKEELDELVEMKTPNHLKGSKSKKMTIKELNTLAKEYGITQTVARGIYDSIEGIPTKELVELHIQSYKGMLVEVKPEQLEVVNAEVLETKKIEKPVCNTTKKLLSKCKESLDRIKKAKEVNYSSTRQGRRIIEKLWKEMKPIMVSLASKMAIDLAVAKDDEEEMIIFNKYNEMIIFNKYNEIWKNHARTKFIPKFPVEHIKSRQISKKDYLLGLFEEYIQV